MIKPRVLPLGPLALVTGLCLPTIAVAEAVTLTAKTGDTRITGEILSFDDGLLRLRTAFGDFSIDAARVRCEGAACPEMPEIGALRVSGVPSLMTALMPALITGFSEERGLDLEEVAGEAGPVLRVQDGADAATAGEIVLAAAPAPQALAALTEGEAQLAIVDSSSAALDGVTPDAQAVLALDGIVIAAHPANPVRSITLEEITRIYSGEVTNWSDLGGTAGPIRVYAIDPQSDLTAAFDDLVLRPYGATRRVDATYVRDEATLVEVLGQDRNGIGFLGYGVSQAANILPIRGNCGIQTPANAFTIRTEEYPLTRKLVAHWTGTAMPPLGRALMDFVQTDDAQRIVATSGYVDQNVTELSVNEQGLRFLSSVLPSDAETTIPQLQEMSRDLVAAERMSITFRFDEGSSRLDARAARDIERLLLKLEAGAFEQKEILLVGFTDSVGRSELNEVLSQARSAQVRSEILRAAPAGAFDEVPILAVGFGELSPLGCNESSVGRGINRRVEVWVRNRTG